MPVIGIERGIFADSMGETAIETRLFDSGPQAVESLFAGAIDVAYVGPGSALSGFLNSGERDCHTGRRRKRGL